MDTIVQEQENLDRIINIVENLSFDDSAIKGQIIDESVVEWYSSRFSSFIEDGVPAAINAYLSKLQNDDSVNEITRLAVMHEALNKQLNK